MMLEASNTKYVFASWIVLEEERIMVKMVFMSNSSTSLFRGGLLNLNHCPAASLQLEHDILRLDLDMIFVTEPYVAEGQVAGITSLSKVYQEGSPRATIVLKRHFNFVPKLISKDIVDINVNVYNVNIICICVYCPP
ncbi:hypothetical protein AVEN_262051-1 [Araneus ventricosus]|uniref:Uncharacterized protein n=1 Tax=Araneus ventricosus TaxID=182803 RepID=A0A4Y2NN51_ARAVE|nr:hypothetical protein AVEN_262051-1 [Araneus ventricosus]